LTYARIEMSEVPFTFFVFLSLLMFIKTFQAGNTLRQPYIWILTASVIITFYIRSLGISLIGASVLILLLNKRWVQAAVLVGSLAVAYAPWAIRTANLGGNSYAKQVKMVNPYKPELGTLT